MTTPTVTIVVPPRDRFSRVRVSLESLYQNTDYPFDLVYVDGNSPPRVRSYLQREAATRHFRLIRTEHYLSPNQARNLGARDVRTKYVVFLDNDVEVEPGWLTHLVACAEETEASAVTPLIFEGALEDQVIHTFGGLAEFTEENGVRGFHEVHVLNKRTLDDVKPQIRRMVAGFFEFHCVLLRREVLDKLGPCDEAFLSNQEHLDLSLLIRQAGGTVYVEPRAHVAFPYDALLDRNDIEYARLRWSDDWNRRSTQHFVEKWKVHPTATWVNGSIDWANGHRGHLERCRRRPVSVAKSVVKSLLPKRAYNMVVQALQG